MLCSPRVSPPRHARQSTWPKGHLSPALVTLRSSTVLSLSSPPPSLEPTGGRGQTASPPRRPRLHPARGPPPVAAGSPPALGLRPWEEGGRQGGGRRGLAGRPREEGGRAAGLRPRPTLPASAAPRASAASRLGFQAGAALTAPPGPRGVIYVTTPHWLKETRPKLGARR